MNYFLGTYFLFGLFLATYYDTWLIGIGVGSLALIAYYSTRWVMPDSDLYQYVLSAVGGVFMAQFIYQMHGMFEMHFFAFIGSALLITYQNWKLQIPLTLVVVVHHGTFGYLQYIGFDQVFFTQLDYMTLEVFIYHVSLAAVIFSLCGLWAYKFQKIREDLVHEVDERAALGQQLEDKNKDITDSILYAEKLQKATFPEEAGVRESFERFFVYSSQKNIVGGDFYWMHKDGDTTIIACADCTGHGVPGAFMTIIGINILNRMMLNRTWQSPDTALKILDQELNNAIGRKTSKMDDGMDISLCIINTAKRQVKFAGAMNPVILVSNGNAHTFRGSRYGLGAYIHTDEKVFDAVEFEYKKGDMLYMFTDGYLDQFGGPNTKKYTRRRFTKLLMEMSNQSADEQRRMLDDTLDSWRGSLPQTDDIMVLGIGL